MVQHEQPHEYSHHRHIVLQHDPAPIHETQYSQSAEDQEQGHNRGQPSQSIVHYAQTSDDSPKSEEEYAPVYQYVQAQHEEQSHHAPVHHQTQNVPVPQHHSQGHEVQYNHQLVAFHHGPQLQHGAQEAQLYHGAQEAQLHHGAQEVQLHHAAQEAQLHHGTHEGHVHHGVQLHHASQLHHAPSQHQVESNAHKSHHHEEPVDYYVSQSK